MVGSIIVAAVTNTAVAAFSIAQTVAAFAINFAVSSIVTRVFGQSAQGPQDSGTREQVPPSSVNAIPIVYGDSYLGGTFVDAVLSIDQKTMYYVMAVSCISPNGQFTFDRTKFYYGDRLITFDGTDQTKVISLTDEAGNVDTKISDNLFISLFRSTAAGAITPLNGVAAPSTVMGGADIDAALRWASSGRQMNGLAFAIIKLNYNQDAGTTSLSPITFYAKHYLNSTGAAKPGDVWYDYITNAAYGGAVGATFVDANSATALNVYADQTITYTPSGGGSATQARYRMNGVLDAGQTVLSNLDKIMSCCDSWMAYNAALGQWSIVINKAETTAYAFNDNNIIGEIRVSATDITQSINQVEAKFPDKNARDQPNFVNLKTPTLLLYPNEPTNKYSVTYDLCNDSVQAQYLANRILEQAREDLIVSFSTTYYGIQVDAGDVVSVTNSDYGWSNKLFRVVKVNEASLPDGSLGAKLEMNEYSAAVYDDASITQYAPVSNSENSSVEYFSALSAPTVVATNADSPIPNFNVQISIPAIGRVTFSELYYTSIAIPTADDWRLLSGAGRVNGEPITSGTNYVYENQVLPTGADPSATYYFSYLVGNDIARSAQSPSSAAFTWTPTGATGPSGDSVDIIFRRSATQPATPAPSVGTPVDWYSDVDSVPAGADPIWSSVGTNTGVGTNYVWQTPLLIEGQNGTDGLSIAELMIYRRSATAPATPTGGSFNFTTQTLTAPTSWSSAIPAGTDPVYTSRAVASIQGITGTDSTLTWSAPVLSIQNGATGATGATGPRNAQVFFFYNTEQATAPAAPTAAEITYNFSTQVATISTAGWSVLFNPSAPDTTTASNKYWAVKVAFQETTFGGAYTETISSVFTWQNLDGLVTFTNLSTATGPLGTGATFIDGGSITANSLTVNKITSGVTSTLNGGTFALGATGTVLNGFSGVGAFESNTNAKYGVMAFLENAAATQGAGIGACVFGNGAPALGAFSSTSVSYNSFYTAFAGATNSVAGNGRYNRSIGTAGNNDLIPFNSSVLNNSDNGGYFAYFGATASNRVTEAYLANTTTLSAGVFRRYNTAGTTLVNETYLNNGSYSVESTLGAIYSAGGYLPFTGVHDGLIEESDGLAVGDIVVDYQVEAVLNPSNIVMLYQKSTVANQKGAIGVCIEIFDVPPTDWNEYENTGEVDPITGAPVPNPQPIPNPMYYPIAAGQKVIHVNSLGEGTINVTGEGGNIDIGDLIVTSSTAGKGMKQADDIVRSITVAKARQPVTFSGPTDVQTIACIYLGG
jgi:hypothetical protein